MFIYLPVAQWLMPLIPIQKIGGSSPFGQTNGSKARFSACFYCRQGFPKGRETWFQISRAACRLAEIWENSPVDCSITSGESLRADHRNSPKSRLVMRFLGLFCYPLNKCIFTPFYAILRANVYQNVYQNFALFFGLTERAQRVLKSKIFCKFLSIFTLFCTFFCQKQPCSPLKNLSLL